ncbi:MAG: tRNA lysidine(34) synthetase TilS [Stappiaceae bacterium]
MPAADKNNTALEEEEAKQLFSGLAELSAVALAVSGGPDSLALLFLYARWRQREAPDQTCVVLTVDHGLRTESAAEAAGVQRLCRSLSLEHRTLTWTGAKPTSDLQAEAREKRYDLMLSEMASSGIGHLVLGHHLDDQAETFLTRLGRGSGVYGLASMAKSQKREGVVLLRPLLDVPKRRLLATLERDGRTWVDDPSNRDPKYLRSRLRALMPDLEQIGLTSERLAGTARRLRRAADALNFATEQLGDTVLSRHPAGPVSLKIAPFFEAPEEIGLRLLSQILAFAGGHPYGPRLEHIEGLYQSLQQLQSGEFRGASLAGVICYVAEKMNDRVWFYRENRGTIQSLPLGPRQNVLWDSRFRITLSELAPDQVVVGTLGTQNFEHLSGGPSSLWPKKVFETAPLVTWAKQGAMEKSQDGLGCAHYVHGLSKTRPNWLVVAQEDTTS